MFTLPVSILKFWYLEAPLELFSYFANINKAFFTLFSLPLMLKTFFRPWKNEYREGLVGFSIFMGMAFKSILIFTDLVIFAFLLTLEIIIFFLFMAMPILSVYLAFFKL